MKSTLLLLALFGAVCGQSWMNGYGLRRVLFAPDSAEAMVQKFLAKMVKSIESKDTSSIDGLFQPGFVFKGCKGVYNKQQIIGLLSQLPANHPISLSLKSVQDLGASIKYTVSATGFGASAVEAEFILNKVDQQLESGVVPACQKTHFFGIVAEDSAQVMVEKFLARMSRSIQSKDQAIIRGLFQPGFIFKGCKGVYNKEQIVGLLSQLPSNAPISLSLKSVKDLGASIKYTVSATGFGASAVEAEFILNKVDQQLESGVVPACQKTHFFGIVAEDSAQVMVEKFLARMSRSIQSRDQAIIRGLFQPGFIFKGCKGTYNKEQIVGLLSQLPANAPISLSLKSVKDLGASIKYTVSATGFGASAVEAEFILNKVDQQLESGSVPACQKTHFFGIVAEDSAQVMVEKFLARMARSIESKDTSIIRGLFQPGFEFKGCKATYTKDQVVGMLSKIPTGTKFSMTLKSVKDLGTSIKYTVSASGFSASAIEAVFVLDKADQQLAFGAIPDCPKSLFIPYGIIGRSAQPDSAQVIAEFLKSAKPIFDSRDATKIGALFDDSFEFKGCQGTYSKAQAVEKIVSRPIEPELDFQLISSQWGAPGQIEYIVSVSVPGMVSIQAQFVYCPERGVLKSGRIPTCPPKTFY